MATDDSNGKNGNGKNGNGDGKKALPPGPEPMVAKPMTGEPVVGFPPSPPGIPQQTFNIATQLAQPNTFASMSDELKREVIKSVDQNDQRHFEHAMEKVRSDERVELEALKDSGTGRRQILVLAGALCSVLLICGTVITVTFISNGKPELGHTVMMSGLGCLGTLLGGMGLSSLVKRKPKE